MAYIKRHIAETLGKMLRQFKVVLVTGPRQVGKSTLLKNELKDFEYVSLDDMAELELARNDPALFFRNHGLPLVIDEVQYAPELFRQIKLLVDRSDNRGQLYPVEIKKASQAVLGMAKNFPCIRQLDSMQAGTILCQCDKKLLLAENVRSLPLEYV